jgi:hypothetical protein
VRWGLSRRRVVSFIAIRMHPDGQVARILPAGSILRQDVDFTKLLLNLLDSLEATRVFFSDTLGRHGCPALIAWYDRNRDCWRTVIKRQ